MIKKCIKESDALNSAQSCFTNSRKRVFNINFCNNKKNCFSVTSFIGHNEALHSFDDFHYVHYNKLSVDLCQIKKI